nr:MAG TPA: hypothetical protein [Microviridae sp.]
MKSPNVRFYGMVTERVPNKAGSEIAPTWKAVKRANGTTEYIKQPPENIYEKIQRAGEGYDLASAIARLEAGDVSIKAKSMIYTEGTPLENLPKDVVTMHEKAQAAAETLEQLKKEQKTEPPKQDEPPKQEEKKEEVSDNKPEQ